MNDVCTSVYLRMASKVQTAIGQIVEGKFISVTICHECYDVSDKYVLILMRESVYA